VWDMLGIHSHRLHASRAVYSFVPQRGIRCKRRYRTLTCIVCRAGQQGQSGLPLPLLISRGSSFANTGSIRAPPPFPLALLRRRDSAECARPLARSTKREWTRSWLTAPYVRVQCVQADGGSSTAERDHKRRDGNPWGAQAPGFFLADSPPQAKKTKSKPSTATHYPSTTTHYPSITTHYPSTATHYHPLPSITTHYHPLPTHYHALPPITKKAGITELSRTPVELALDRPARRASLFVFLLLT
jgi:hypothetical protein